MKRNKWFSIVLSFVMFLTVFTAVQPSNTEAATRNTPVVFVHGLTGSASNFVFIERYLRSQGWSSNELYSIELPSKQGHQELNSTAIQQFVDEVLRETGADKVNIVAHSMGGANSLYYIRNKGGDSKVEKLVTLGGANGLTTNIAPRGIETTSIYSSSDFIVASSLSRMYGANNILIHGVSHVGLLNSFQVNRLIKSALEE
ncbi:alpha/beta fold hydrolase [Alkalihalobacillus sp. LMS39]|uniref:esterase/lipase family protein n=1 Tax=Alkalihalobacillus sp. LMS39 TaxID=2924032 RepID=UPI001FB3715F|nr:alpha/beta fold hydrolase [Alkalihalobacillus sp. LMS39]UOE96129.1 alpha/beta fold hydrolase [Alkalihalobacillus sp. LMS39]